MSHSQSGVCEKCTQIFFATPGWFDRIGSICGGCAGLLTDEIIEEEDVIRLGN